MEKTMARTDDIAAGGECAPAIQPGRKITGLSAILLPFDTDGRADWNGFENHVAWTAKAGLIPAVNMDTGYVALLDDVTRRQVLDRMAAMNLPGGFVAGVCINDAPGASFDADAYRRRLEEVERGNGTPVIMQSYGLTAQDDDGIAASYQALAAACDRFIAFELGTMFAPFGRIYPLNVYAELMHIPNCIGAKHSSLRRIPEWQTTCPARSCAARLQGIHRKRPGH